MLEHEKSNRRKHGGTRRNTQDLQGVGPVDMACPRQYAKINGGVETVVAEKGDTLLFDHEGSIRQYFPNGAVLEFDKKTGNATIFFKGKEMASADNVLVREMPSLQNMAARF